MEAKKKVSNRKGKKLKYTPLTESQLLEAEQIVADTVKENPDFYSLPTSERSANDLVNFFVKSTEDSQQILPKNKRRYAVYLRKSTDDEMKQIHSLEDQEIECLELAKRLDISVRKEDIFKESRSAKKSNNRPIFNDILAGIKSKKYQGLISWSPDRLSRNMKEAGEIIEMLDYEQIQDLHFCTYQFDNTPNGKMMLGILFATSKQYSDKLSVDVSRGNKGTINEGKYIGVIKKGYYVDSAGNFMPDAHNWQLLRQAVVMRLKDGKTNKEVADFLTDSHFSWRKHKDDKYKLVKMNKQTVSNLFNDPFYCGVYKHGNNIVDLADLPVSFIPLMTPDEFISINRNTASSFNEAFIGRSTVQKRLEFGILREKVICDFCGKTMIFQRTRLKKGVNKGKFMLSFYCRNKDCTRHNDEEAIRKYGKKLPKSIRAKIVTAHIEWAIRHLTENTVEAHKQYIRRLEQELAVKRETAKIKLANAKAELQKQKDTYSEYLTMQRKSIEDYNKFHKGKLEYHQNLVDAYSANVTSLQNELKKLKEPLPTREQFVELIVGYLKTLLNVEDIMEEDRIYQELVLNLRAGDNSVSVIKLNPPYDLMVDLEKICSGGRDGT